MLSRDALLSGLAAKTKDVEIDGLGVVRVAQMGVANRVALLELVRVNLAEIEAYEADQKLPADERAGLAKVKKLDQALLTIIYSLVDDAGELLLSVDDMPIVERLAFDQVMKLWEAVTGFNKQATIGEVEEQKKSSGATRKSGSRSA